MDVRTIDMKRSIFSKSIIKGFGLAVVLAVIAANGFTQNASMRATAAPAPLERRVFRAFASPFGSRRSHRREIDEAAGIQPAQTGYYPETRMTRHHLELRHDILTKYVYSAVDTRTSTVLAGGKVSSLGATGRGKSGQALLQAIAERPSLSQRHAHFTTNLVGRQYRARVGL
jgi:F0F1-type ATP synthase membrane subunit c/vacuolar-type H+-ATPase subunit K